MSVSTPEALTQQILDIAVSGRSAGDVIEAAAGDRGAVEAARDRVAAKVRQRVDDFESTAALRLLNLVLSEMPRHDPLDWQVRWEQRRKP